MNFALQDAYKGIHAKDGGPFGACIFLNDELISVGHNTVLLDKDSTCHAEINAIRAACKKLNTNNLSSCELYSTCEPCPMCWGGIMKSKIKKIYVCSDRVIPAKFGFDDSKFYDFFKNLYSSDFFRFHIIPSTFIFEFLEKCAKTNFKMCLNEGFLLKEYNKIFDLEKKKQKIYEDEKKENEEKNEEEKKIFKKMIEKLLNNYNNKKKKFPHTELLPYAAMIMKNNQIISECYETEMYVDATATVETIAIRQACKKLNTHDLKECRMYVLIEPDVMSMCAATWARIDVMYAAVPNTSAAGYGFTSSYLQHKELDCEAENRVMKKIECDFLARDSEKVFEEWQKSLGVIY